MARSTQGPARSKPAPARADQSRNESGSGVRVPSPVTDTLLLNSAIPSTGLGVNGDTVCDPLLTHSRVGGELMLVTFNEKLSTPPGCTPPAEVPEP